MSTRSWYNKRVATGRNDRTKEVPFSPCSLLPWFPVLCSQSKSVRRSTRRSEKTSSEPSIGRSLSFAMKAPEGCRCPSSWEAVRKNRSHTRVTRQFQQDRPSARTTATGTRANLEDFKPISSKLFFNLFPKWVNPFLFQIPPTHPPTHPSTAASNLFTRKTKRRSRIERHHDRLSSLGYVRP